MTSFHSYLGLLVISGPPCSGKTSVGEKISSFLGVPFLPKSYIEETLFNFLGWKEEERFNKLTGAGYALLFKMLESHLRSGATTVIESNFNPRYDSRKILDIKKRYASVPIQIFCKCDHSVIMSKCQDKIDSGSIHPAHELFYNTSKFHNLILHNKFAPLQIEGHLLQINTTRFEDIDFTYIYRWILDRLNLDC
jgi:predicted kinase